MVTSALVIAEGHGWFLRRYDPGRAVQFLAFVEKLAPLSVTAVDSQELRKAASFVRKFGDQRLTLADAHGLVIMGERLIRTCWSTDRHLALTGAASVV